MNIQVLKDHSFVITCVLNSIVFICCIVKDRFVFQILQSLLDRYNWSHIHTCVHLKKVSYSDRLVSFLENENAKMKIFMSLHFIQKTEENDAIPLCHERMIIFIPNIIFLDT